MSQGSVSAGQAKLIRDIAHSAGASRMDRPRAPTEPRMRTTACERRSGYDALGVSTAAVTGQRPGVHEPGHRAPGRTAHGPHGNVITNLFAIT